MIDLVIRPRALSGSAAADDAQPVIAAVAPGGEPQALVGTVAVSWVATDPGSGVSRTFAVVDAAGTSPLVLDVPGTATLAPGQHTLDVFAEDAAR